MDPATRRLALIAAGIGGTLLVVVAGWSMLSHRIQGVPVVQAESGPMRVKPANPGGLQVAGVNNDIFSGGSDIDVKKLAPPPQTPDPQALRAPQASAPSPGVMIREPVAAPPPREAAVVAAEPPREPAAASAARPPVATIAPPVRPADKLASAAAAARAAGGRDVSVQLAALSSESAAKAEWERLVRRWPKLLGGHRPAFSRIEHGGQTFWRLRTGGFGDMARATMFCEQLRAGGGGCSVADF